MDLHHLYCVCTDNMDSDRNDVSESNTLVALPVYGYRPCDPFYNNVASDQIAL